MTPRRMKDSMVAASSAEVTMITSALTPSARRMRSSSRPLIWGMYMSRMIRSTKLLRSQNRAGWAAEKVCTTVKRLSFSTYWRFSWVMTGSSSMITVRYIAGSSCG